VALVFIRPLGQPRRCLHAVLFVVIKLAWLSVRPCAISFQILAVREKLARTASAMTLVEYGHHDALTWILRECGIRAPNAKTSSGPASRKQLGQLPAKRAASRSTT